MTDNLLTAIIGISAAITAAIIAAIATRVRLLPDVVDISIVPTGAGVGGLLAAALGAALRFDADRLGRISLFGNLSGGLIALLSLVVLLVRDVLS